MKNYKNIILFVLSLFAVMQVFGGLYNENGDFSVKVDRQDVQIYNDNIATQFSLILTNQLDEKQNFTILAPRLSGWDIKTNIEKFILSGKEVKELTLDLKANSEFDYGAEIISPDLIKFAQQTDYKGSFNFPLVLKGQDEEITLVFSVDIIPKSEVAVSFVPKFSKLDVSPEEPLQYTISAENIFFNENVEVRVILNDETIKIFKESFTPEVYHKIYQQEIPVTFNPGSYDFKILIRKENSATKANLEWYESVKINVKTFEKVLVAETVDPGVFSQETKVEVSNVGNVDSKFERIVEGSFFKNFFFFTDNAYSKLDNGSILISESLAKGESKTIEYSQNYLSLYIILLIIIFILGYIYHRKTSNPLDVETSIYEIRRVEHEGVKSFKVRFGFENLKVDLIDELKVVFRMPGYLNVAEGSFLLVEPNHALKGRDQYKLIWDFKKFEKNDSRILGFTLINRKGVLGDVRLPDLEFEVKINGRHKRYFVNFPIIRG